MLLAIVVVDLFGLGVLGLFGFWRIVRKLDALHRRGVRLDRGLRRANRRAVRTERSVRDLVRLARAQQFIADQTRMKLIDFVDGPVSQRHPLLPGGRDAASGGAPRGGSCLD